MLCSHKLGCLHIYKENFKYGPVRMDRNLHVYIYVYFILENKNSQMPTFLIIPKLKVIYLAGGLVFESLRVQLLKKIKINNFFFFLHFVNYNEVLWLVVMKVIFSALTPRFKHPSKAFGGTKYRHSL